MLHIALHFLLPLVIALVIFKRYWQRAFALMLTGLIIDLDHLLANPVYDPLRCSIGFHPLHSEVAIGLYVLLFILSLPHRYGEQWFGRHRSSVNLVAIGLGCILFLMRQTVWFNGVCSSLLGVSSKQKLIVYNSHTGSIHQL